MSAFLRNAGGLAQYIESDPGFIVGPIAMVLGFIINFIFAVVFKVTTGGSLGISIIFLTIIVRTLMLPLGFKQQKSMYAMQRLTPEIDKIKAKYGDSKDPELQRKMNVEIQALYAKNKVSVFGGCLPLLVTMPIFFALTYVMRQTYLYITPLGDIYREIARVIPLTNPESWTATVVPIAQRMIPSSGIEGFDLANIADFAKVINKLKPDDVTAILGMANGQFKDTLVSLFNQKTSIETFIGINLLTAPGLSFPGFIIPLLSGATQFLTFWITEKTSPTPATGSAASQQKIMKYAMPAMMIYFTMTISGGVGLYWTVSNIYQIFQQYFITKYHKKNFDAADAAKKKTIIVKDVKEVSAKEKKKK